MDLNQQSDSIDEHKKRLEAVRAEAEALPADRVTAPDMPVKTFIEEASTSAAAAQKYLTDLSNVGMTANTVDNFDRHLQALISAQVLWNTERGFARSDALRNLVTDSEAHRQYLLDAADLALRRDPDAQGRLSLIREGEGLADLSFDLADLAVLTTSHRAQFEAIKLNVDEAAEKATTLKKALQSALADEAVGKTLSGYKEMRDRCFVLAQNDLKEIRAFARFAFRNDKGNSRLSLFMSAHNRRKDRIARRNAARKAQPQTESAES